MPTNLILIRHGETDSNCQQRYSGHTDNDLNENGMRQARRLSKVLRNEKVDMIYVSDLKRTTQLAQIIFNGSNIKRLKSLRELNFGIFEGLTYDEIRKKYPTIYGKWLDNYTEERIPKGEGLRDLHRRMKRFLSKVINENKNKTVAVVTHGGPIRMMVSIIEGLDINNFFNIDIDLASVTRVSVVRDKPKVQSINKTY